MPNSEFVFYLLPCDIEKTVTHCFNFRRQFIFQVWRLFTTFLFFGSFGFNFFFNMIFTYKYCRMLEENSFRNRPADFIMMILFGGVCMVICAYFINLLFLGQKILFYSQFTIFISIMCAKICGFLSILKLCNVW